jgi:hypothetical protein
MEPRRAQRTACARTLWRGERSAVSGGSPRTPIAVEEGEAIKGSSRLLRGQRQQPRRASRHSAHRHTRWMSARTGAAAPRCLCDH